MSASTRKAISKICLGFAILWFALVGVFEVHYVLGVLRHQSTLHDIFGTIYEEQIEGINSIMMIVYLVPGAFALLLYRRFQEEH